VSHSEESGLTRILAGVEAGDEQAPARLLPLVYEELRRLAQRRMANEPPDHTLEPTALVHEAYMRLAGNDHVVWESRAHLMAVAARAMRQILINHAHHKGAAKRGGGFQRVTLDFALQKLAELRERQQR